MRFAAIIFDMDGTLIDTLSGIATAVNSVLAANDHPTHAEDSYRRFVGSGITTLVKRALPENYHRERQITHLTNQVREIYGAIWREHGGLYSGIASLLDRLTKMGLPLAILSNKPHHFTLEFAAHFLRRWHFDYILGARDDLPLKPDPAGVQDIILELRLEPDRVIFVGDSDVDMHTALNAGIYPIGVSWGFRQRDELISAGARKVINQPLELLNFFETNQTG